MSCGQAAALPSGPLEPLWVRRPLKPCGRSERLRRTPEDRFNHCAEVGFVHRAVSVDIPAAGAGFSRLNQQHERRHVRC